MTFSPNFLPSAPALLRLRADGREVLALSSGGRLRALPGLELDALLTLPADLVRTAIERCVGAELDSEHMEPLAPCQEQEVWAAGVTYLISRAARVEETTDRDVYSRIYEAERPELFFKAAGWRVVGPGRDVGVRPDSGWNVPEPELAVLTNSRGQIVAYSCGNDMSSRTIEGENPLYLPQAKVYNRSCALGPAAVLAWDFDAGDLRVTMEIDRDGERVFEGEARTSDLVRDVAQLCSVLHSCYSLPHGAWLLTGTSIVPAAPYTCMNGDIIRISIDGLGTLVNGVSAVSHTGAKAPPRSSR